MRAMQTFAAILLLTLLTSCAAPTARPTAPGLEESGTFTVRENQLLRAAVGHAGEGTLIYQGWEHRFVFEDMKVGGLGDATVELEGTVYNMQSLADFEGRYTVTNVEFQGGEGLSGVWGKNDNGVVAYVQAKGQNVEIDLQAAGAKFTLK